MTQRTRRNLSDPRIRKIVNSQTSKTKSRNIPKKRKGSESAPVSKFFFYFILFLMLASSAVLLYSRKAEIQQFLHEKLFNASSTGDVVPPHVPETGVVPEQAVEKGTAQSPEEKTPEPKPQQNALQPPISKPLQVEVLNGCGVPKLADKVTRYLRRRRVDVVQTGNYKNFNVTKSRIIDRRGNPENVRKIANILGIPVNRIGLKKDENLQLDATIILGADYNLLKPFN